MKVLGRECIDAFSKKHADIRGSVSALILELMSAEWKTPANVKSQYPKASIIGKNNVVFDICDNKYRIWIKITYETEIALFKKIGTHKEYDRWEIK